MAKKKTRLTIVLLALAFCLIFRKDIEQGFREGWRTVMKD